jgi:hypothetical protein
MEAFFDRLHAGARRQPALRRLAILSRLLLAGAFLPTGMVKLLGHRFTLLGPDNPVGAFFEAMYQTGFYWNFLGLGQVLAGVLLLIPRTTVLGAVLFFPIVTNIAVVTWSIGFGGTRWITAAMLLASSFLLCWDYDRWKSLLFAPAQRPVNPRAPLPIVERLGYVVCGLAALGMLAITRSLLPMELMPWLLGLGGLGAVCVAVGWVSLSFRRHRAEAS